MESDASGGSLLAQRQQQPAFRRGVVAGKSREFLIETLEAEAEAERGSVFEEEFADRGDLSWRFSLSQVKILNRRGRIDGRGALGFLRMFCFHFSLGVLGALGW